MTHPSASSIRPAVAALLLLSLAACQNEPAAPPEGRFVHVVTVEAGKLANEIQLSGEIQAKKDVGLAFRIGGRVLERPVNVGDRVKAGQVIARLEPTLEKRVRHHADECVSTKLRRREINCDIDIARPAGGSLASLTQHPGAD